ncbi:MAG TPA: winged helix-turn-helix transcriptional regulator [Candidatus Lokiarchaeia archaeon]|nr:winged helix-turn-helix transcriptional regulator [Candidatus Lokiarchaeia archaeon]
MDDINRMILTELYKNGRVTLKALEKKTGYTSMGIKKRIDKLVEEGAIKITTLMNARYFNLCAAVILIETDGPETIERIIKRFENCPRIISLFTTVGGYNIVAIVMAENQETLESISIEKCSLRSEKGIRRSEFLKIRDYNYNPFIPVKTEIAQQEMDNPPCMVECKPCNRYNSDACVGCPATTYYKGQL